MAFLFLKSLHRNNWTAFIQSSSWSMDILIQCKNLPQNPTQILSLQAVCSQYVKRIQKREVSNNRFFAILRAPKMRVPELLFWHSSTYFWKPFAYCTVIHTAMNVDNMQQVRRHRVGDSRQPCSVHSQFVIETCIVNHDSIWLVIQSHSFWGSP